MFRFRLLTCASLTFAACSLHGGAGGELGCAAELRVLTYNIHHSEGRDTVFDLNRIAAIISAVNPDLVALQELDQGTTRSGVDVFQLNQLASLTGMQGVFGKTIDYRGGAYGNGALVRNGLRITEIVNRPMPSPVGGEARGLLDLGISLDGDAAPELRFFATHFSAAAGEQTVRLSQAAFINALADGSPLPIVMGGDFNARPTSSEVQSLVTRWADATTATPRLTRTSQIDYVFTHGANLRVASGGDFIVNATTAVASDHYPLSAVVSVVPEPSSAVVLGACGAMMAACRKPCQEGVVRTCGAAPPRAECDLGAVRKKRGRRERRRLPLRAGSLSADRRRHAWE